MLKWIKRMFYKKNKAVSSYSREELIAMGLDPDEDYMMLDGCIFNW